MSDEYVKEVQDMRIKLTQVFPRVSSMALTVGSTLCVLIVKSIEGDLVATAMMKAIMATPERWEEAQKIFKKEFKYKINDERDLFVFASGLVEQIERIQSI
jgi:hypothetical protein